MDLTKEELVQELETHYRALKRVLGQIIQKDRSTLRTTSIFGGVKRIPIQKKSITFDGNVRIFNAREELIKAIGQSEGEKFDSIAEIGVLNGEFSRVLMESLRPTRCYLVDLRLAHLENAFDPQRVVLMEGDSSERIHELQQASLDLAYIDGDHSAQGVRKDVSALLPKMKPRSYLVFNDYGCINPDWLEPYGVIDAVHELINSSDYLIHSMSLSASGLHDICLFRSR